MFDSCRGHQRLVRQRPEIATNLLKNNKLSITYCSPKTVNVRLHQPCFVGISVGIVSSICFVPTLGGATNGAN